MIETTDAIVLRIAPYSTTSHVVTWLTPGHGKLVTAVKGARRAKSGFAGQYDLYYTCELLYYAKERDGIHIARECSPLKLRTELRTNWRSAACASYVCDLAHRITFPGGHEPELYALVETALDFLCRHTPRLLFVTWYELQMARVTGFTPRLDTCAGCDAPIAEHAAARFSFPRGGVLCAECAPRQPGRSVSLSPEHRSFLRGWLRVGAPVLHGARADAGFFDFEEALGLFLPYHLDMDTMPPSRKIALEMISKDASASAGAV